MVDSRHGISSSDLIEIVDGKIDRVRTRSLDLSFNELLDMYNNRELIIDPEYQRLFRWSEEKQSQFIESLILEMPIPPIYVIEQSQGIYELIDGLQRLSSYLHFRGSLEGRKDEYLRLENCDIVKELNGYIYPELPRALQIKLKRNFIRVEVIRQESDPRLRYYIFKRLNTGGELLSEQEIRNCTIRLFDNRFNQFIIDLSQNEDFQRCISFLSDDKKDKKGDQELVLRFFAFKNNQQNYRHDVAPFMTEYMEIISDPQKQEFTFDYLREEEVFNRTFRCLNLTLGENAFSRALSGGRLMASFSPYHYEAFTLGIQKWLDYIELDNQDQINQLAKVFKSIKNETEFRELTTGGGKNTPAQLNRRIQYVEKNLEAIFP